MHACAYLILCTMLCWILTEPIYIHLPTAAISQPLLTQLKVPENAACKLMVHNLTTHKEYATDIHAYITTL